MKTPFSFVLFFLSISFSYGQERLLNPCITFADSIQEIKAYEGAINSRLDAGLSPDYLIRFVVEPSASPEYVLQIEKAGGNFKVVTLLFLKNLWNSQNRGTVKTTRFEKNIPEEVVFPLDSLVKKLTEPSMLHNPAFGIGEDGTNYFFYFRSGTSTQCGECWSPSKGTPLFELVNIFEQMVSYSEDQKVDLSGLVDQITGLNHHIKR